jgi:4-amino-4-deoxy-L-arabinose transferase-like glycosyltransferase
MLPHAIAAVIAVPLLYDTVRRIFGRPAGLTAALALAVLPVSVFTARSDTMDSLMMALDVLAAWLVVRAAETGRTRFLLLAAATMGINFEVKLFEALIPLPAIVLLYALALRGQPRPRLGRLAAAAALFVATALAWPAIVGLVPRGSRPYPIGSRDGSTWNAIFVYNGTQRLNPPSYSPPAGSRPARRRHAAQGGSAAAAQRRAARRQRARHRRAAPGILGATGDAPGPLRLFELGRRRYGQDLGIELGGAFAFGAVALLGALLEWRRRRVSAEAGTSGASLRVAGAIGFGVWLVTGYAIFSRMHGGLHDRYLEAMTPAVAAVLAIGVVEAARYAARRPAVLAALLAAVVGVTAYAVRVAGSDTLLAVFCAASGAAALAIGIARLVGLPGRRARPIGSWSIAAAAGLAVVAVLAPAAVRSRALAARTSASTGNGIQTSRTTQLLSSYLRSHSGNAFYEAATYSFDAAAGLVVHDDRPVLVLTSYTDPVVPAVKLAADAAAGRVRYAIVGGECGIASERALAACPESIRWLRHRSVDVTRETGLPGRGLLFRISVAAKPA